MQLICEPIILLCFHLIYSAFLTEIFHSPENGDNSFPRNVGKFKHIYVEKPKRKPLFETQNVLE